MLKTSLKRRASGFDQYRHALPEVTTLSMSPRSSANPEAARDVGRGRMLLLVSAVAFSTAGFFTREAPVDLWAMIFWRNTFGSTALLVVTLCATPRSPPRLRRLGR